MVLPKVELKLPDIPEQEAVQKSIDLSDQFLTEERWASHQSVLKAVFDLFNLPCSDEVLRALTGFTAGGGFTGGFCGALAGGLTALGIIYGSHSPMPQETYDRFIQVILSEEQPQNQKAQEVINAFLSSGWIFNHLVNDFRLKNGHTDCRELIAPFNPNLISRQRFGSCRRIVRGTAGQVTQLILDLENKRLKPRIDYNIYSHLLE